MSISNLQATKYFDEIYAYFGTQTSAGKSVDLYIDVGRDNYGTPFIGVFDGNNSNSIPLVLMINKTGTGRNWSNELSDAKETFHIVNSALMAFKEQKQKWNEENKDFSLNDTTDFLVEFMRTISSFLR